MAAHLTRLETRTKEFNMRASCWDLKPASVVKASHSFAVYWRDPVLRASNGSKQAHRRPVLNSSGFGGA
jgi:hypothetical protein